MKKLLLCVLALLTLCACAVPAGPTHSQTGPTHAQDQFDTMVKLVQEELEDESLAGHVTYDDAEEIAACYGFRAAALHDGYAISSVYALNAFEIGLFYAKSEANVTVIAEKLRTYLDELEKQYASAAPETARLVRAAEILCHENLCVLVMCPPPLQQRLTELIRTEIFQA